MPGRAGPREHQGQTKEGPDLVFQVTAEVATQPAIWCPASR